ncbi:MULTISPECIES: TetR/AcrR family transcriptional regulator [unclassified Streptomyces]|uniref:TetR/AcrR family transcriptional regulator n=1 Tax=Streptomyces sp. SYP-A7185 TaxID=3040076 RepID=UPI0038F6501C
MPEAEEGLRERHKARRRSRIVDAARELLREEPDSAVGVERIADRAGVAPATVYNLIGPRERLWEALAARFMEEFEDRLAGQDAGDPHVVVRTTVHLFLGDPVVSRRMVRGWEESGLALHHSPLDRLTEAMAQTRARGVLRPDVDTDALAALVATACVGALHQWVAALIDDRLFLTRALFALDVALAAAGVDGCREELLAPLRPRETE